MSKRASPTLIGAFTLGAIALGILTLTIIGGGRFWEPTRRFVVVFEGSLHGLSLGAPVTMRGVTIGQVGDIYPVVVTHKGEPTGIDVLVTIELRRGRLHAASGATLDLSGLSDEELMRLLDHAGLRAQLALQSFLTGQLYVDLDFFPGSPVTKADVHTDYPQIATIQTGFTRLGKAIENLPVEELTTRGLAVLEGLERRINSAELDNLLTAGAESAMALSHTLTELDTQIAPLAESLRRASDAVQSALGQAERTLALESGVPGELAQGLIATLAQARQTLDPSQGPTAEMIVGLGRAAATADEALEEIRLAAADLRGLLDKRSPTRQQLLSVLGETAAAARSLRALTDYLERHPEALIHGKR